MAHQHRQMGLAGVQRQVLQLNAYERHKKFVNDYVMHYGGGRPAGWKPPLAATAKTDRDILRENHRFLRGAEDDEVTSWEKRLAKKYYDKLFKEYAIADLSRYREGAIGLRWRTAKEVVAGKGQFVCGVKRCEAHADLQSYELDFVYREAGEKKQALVKVRVCPRCAARLNYKHQQRRARKPQQPPPRGGAGEAEGERGGRQHLHGAGADANKRPRGAGPEAARDSKRSRKRKRARRERSSSSSSSGGSSSGGSSSGSSASGSSDSKAHALSRSQASAKDEPDAASVWSAPVAVEKTVDEEFDDYFEELIG